MRIFADRFSQPPLRTLAGNATIAVARPRSAQQREEQGDERAVSVRRPRHADGRHPAGSRRHLQDLGASRPGGLSGRRGRTRRSGQPRLATERGKSTDLARRRNLGRIPCRRRRRLAIPVLGGRRRVERAQARPVCAGTDLHARSHRGGLYPALAGELPVARRGLASAGVSRPDHLPAAYRDLVGGRRRRRRCPRDPGRPLSRCRHPPSLSARSRHQRDPAAADPGISDPVQRRL